MPQIIFLPHDDICPEGAVIDAEPGTTICDAASKHDIEIEHACEKSCACTTCHVYIREGLIPLPSPRKTKMICSIRHGVWSLIHV